MREWREGNVFSRYRLLTWLGAFVCFVLIPVLLLNALIDNTLRLRYEEERQRVFVEMDSRLDFLSQHVDISFYLHKLLKQLVDRADKHASPVQSLKASITAIKSRYPGLFKFIVWDARGQTVESLTDEKSYKYIVNNLGSFFVEIAQHCRREYPGFPELLTVVEKRLNLFRAYIGRFLVASHLRFPFQKGDHGRFILGDAPDRFPLFWFDSRTDFTIFCAANPQEKHRHIGVEQALKELNSISGDISTSFIDLRQINKRPASTEFEQLLLLELGKFENASLPHRELEDHLVAFKLLDPYLRGYCTVNRQDLPHGYPQRLKAVFFARLATALLLILFVSYCYSLRLTRVNFSIRTRIALLFIYANGLPLLILGTIGNEYIQQLEGSLLHTTHRNQERLLEEVDAGFKRYRSVLEIKTREALASYSANVRDRIPDNSDIPFFKNLIESLNAEEAYVFGADGEILIGQRRARKAQSQTILKIFAAHSLHFTNRTVEDLTTEKTGKHMTASYIAMSKEAMSREGMGMFRAFLHIIDKVEKFSFGTELRMCYMTFFGNPEKRWFHSLLIMSWLDNQVQEAYAGQQAMELNSGRDGKTFLAGLAQHSGSLIGNSAIADTKLRAILHKAFNLQSVHENALYHEGKRYIVSALAGRQLDNLSLAAIVSADAIENAVKKAQIQLLWLSMISLLIVSGVVYTLTRQFLEPVKQLAESVKQIGLRNFGFRNSISSTDEFGDLGRVFNSTMAGMHELEAGRIIQETLLPEAHYQSGNIEIYAKSISMTKLGGDYFDYCTPKPGETGVFMGDVAGHGIPAALIMAMAKAIVLIDRESLHDPALLLTSLHNVLFRLKSDSFKRMMTCQYLVMNDQTGACSFANAGHCYPIIVADTGSTSSFSEIIGSPVGITKRARYQNHNLAIRPGDTLILYSDGMLEARNPQNIEYGPERLLSLARSAWHKDIQQYYTNLYQANLDWSVKVEDDITIVLVRFTGEATA